MRYLANLMVAAVLGLGAQAHAASITWLTPQDDTGFASDVLVTGSLFSAGTASASNVTLNGLTFGGALVDGSTASFQDNPNITISNINGYGQSGSPPPATWDVNYQALVATSIYDIGPGPIIQITGLTIGQDYQVQLFTPFWNYPFQTTFSDGTNVSDLLNIGVADSLIDAQNVIGNFTADDSTQTIYLGTPFYAAMFGAIDVQAAPAPLPGAGVLSGLAAFAMLGLRRLRRSRAL